MDTFRMAGYRIIEFSMASKMALVGVSERLIPREQEILDEWVRRQCKVWEPPGLSPDELRQVFGGLLRNILKCMDRQDLEVCISDLEEAGVQLAARRFPFEALVISIHFLEESYLPYLLDPPSEHTQEWLLSMDEFLHAALASVATAYFEAYRKELLDQAEVGRIVQEGLLAHIPKKVGDLEIAHIYLSARERAQLGGDFLDYFTIGGDGAAFVVGDLAGHGLDAAADSVMLRSLFRGFMRENPVLTDAMSRLNRVLMTELKSGLFATALALSYELSGRVGLVSAGHPYPIICNDHACGLLELTGTALAIDDTSTYTLVETELARDGVLVVYTDGLIEARRGIELFGDERAIQAVADARNGSARAIAEHLIDESLRHAGGKFADDVAVLVLKRRAD
ncbi:MAG: serine/threonine-protein phosphatase [Armatimonadetes bacterium]|nr:serine/threonine-protein phosphatase [Armatimonadota bacterium]